MCDCNPDHDLPDVRFELSYELPVPASVGAQTHPTVLVLQHGAVVDAYLVSSLNGFVGAPPDPTVN